MRLGHDQVDQRVVGAVVDDPAEQVARGRGEWLLVEPRDEDVLR